MPQRKVAARINMNVGYFSRLENDRLGFNPTRETVEKIARALEASPEERGELLAAAGRLDPEVESLARAASEQPAVRRLFQIIARLPPEGVEKLAEQAERYLAEFSEEATGSKASRGRRQGGKSQHKVRH